MSIVLVSTDHTLKHFFRCSDIFLIVQRQTMLLQHRAAFTKLSSTAFIAAMTSSGGSEEDCRTFADETIKDIEATITTTQAGINAVATGASCAAMGQDQVQAQTAKVAAAKAAVQNAETDVASKQRAKDTAASATFTVTFDLMTTKDANCRDPTGQESYQVVKNAADAAIAKLATAKQTLVDAKAAVTAAEGAHTAVVEQASQLKSGCLCRVHTEQKKAQAAASTATASHAADWKQAHELICALDKTTTCTVPTCPTVTQPTLAAGVSDATCIDAMFYPNRNGWMGCNQRQCICDVAYGRFVGSSAMKRSLSSGQGTLDGPVECNKGYQKFTITQGGSYTITARGAAGGSTLRGPGGVGALARTTITLTAGDELIMVVGQKGANNPTSSHWGASGGGGSFVARVVPQGGAVIGPVAAQTMTTAWLA